MKSVGAVVDVADDGNRAVEMADRADYDAILMDVEMPGMDGFEATARIHGNRGNRNIPIIAMTAHVSADYRDRSLSAGMTDHVSKPIVADPRVLAVLSKWTARAEMESIRDAHHVQGAIDFDSALSRTGGNRHLLCKLLALFHEMHAALRPALESALRDADWATAARLVHNVTGSAGNISATRLYDRARELEDAIRSAQHREIEEKLPAFLAAFNEVLAACKMHAATKGEAV